MSWKVRWGMLGLVGDVREYDEKNGKGIKEVLVREGEVGYFGCG